MLMRVVERRVEEQFVLIAILFRHAPVSSIKHSIKTVSFLRMSAKDINAQSLDTEQAGMARKDPPATRDRVGRETKQLPTGLSMTVLN